MSQYTEVRDLVTVSTLYRALCTYYTFACFLPLFAAALSSLFAAVHRAVFAAVCRYTSRCVRRSLPLFIALCSPLFAAVHRGVFAAVRRYSSRCVRRVQCRSSRSVCRCLSRCILLFVAFRRGLLLCAMAAAHGCPKPGFLCPPKRLRFGWGTPAVAWASAGARLVSGK